MPQRSTEYFVNICSDGMLPKNFEIVFLAMLQTFQIFSENRAVSLEFLELSVQKTFFLTDPRWRLEIKLATTNSMCVLFHEKNK